MSTFGVRITKLIPGEWDDILLEILKEPLSFLIITLGFFFAYQFLDFPADIDAFHFNVLKLLLIISATWFVTRFIESFLDHFLKPLLKKSKNKLDDQVLPILKKALKATVIIFAILLSLSNFGFDVWALVAGLGIGGLAFAFAAQATIADVFGGLSILISRPFVVGDVIEFENRTGTVTEISLRHTRFRDFDDRIIFVPNSKIANAVLVNISSAPRRKATWVLGLTTATSTQKMLQAKKIIEKAIVACSLCDTEKYVYFDEFGSSALNIKVIFFSKTNDVENFMRAKEMVGLAIKKDFEKAGIELAYTTHTIYLKK